MNCDHGASSALMPIFPRDARQYDRESCQSPESGGVTAGPGVGSGSCGGSSFVSWRCL